MNTVVDAEPGALDSMQLGTEKVLGGADDAPTACTELSRSVYAVLETYSNVHRGSGQHSMVSTQLYEEAREIILDHLGLSIEQHAVIFCTPRRAERLVAELAPGSFQMLSSDELGLPLGVRALAVARHALPKGAPYQTGGGTAKLVAPNWVLWAKAPDIFEAGTPAIVNVIAFARALQLVQRFGKDAFRGTDVEGRSAKELLWHDNLEHYAGHELFDQLRQSLIGRNSLVPTIAGAMPYINLDNGASTPTFLSIWEVVRHAWQVPSPARPALIDEVKSIVAAVLNAPLPAYEVVFTSNTTEAINLVAESLHNAQDPDVEPVVLNTFLEHNSNELPWRTAGGLALVRLSIDENGFVDLNELETQLRAYNADHAHGKQRIQLVSVSGASNVLGVYNDLAAISAITHQYGALLLVDAAQLVAHRKVDVAQCGIDYLAFSAHKAYAPFGAGVLLAKQGLLQFSSAEWESIRASGEENVGGIAALGKAFVLLQRLGFDLIQAEEQALTAQALRGLAQIPEVTVYGIKDPDSPAFARKGGVIPFNLKNTVGEKVAGALAAEGGIGVRSGCHCAHLTVKHMLGIPWWLEQLQWGIFGLFPKLSPPGVVRISLGIENTPADIDALLVVLGKIAEQIRTKQASAVAGDGTEEHTRAEVARQLDDFTNGAVQRVYAPAAS